MSGGAAVVPGARPPEAAFVLRRVGTWLVVVYACALPVMIVTWAAFTPAERAAEGLGALVWAIAMVIAAERRRWTAGDSGRRAATWLAGAVITALVHAGLALVGGAPGLFLWFAPAVWTTAPLLRALASGSDFANALGWTLACGAQTALVAWLCGRAFDSARQARRRRVLTRHDGAA